MGKEQVHKVNISKDFYICRYEVTVEQMCVFLNVYQSRNSRTLPVKALHNGSTAAWCFQYSGAAPNLIYKPRAGKNRHPVVNVTWPCAEQFCEWLSAELGVKVRLPRVRLSGNILPVAVNGVKAICIVAVIMQTKCLFLRIIKEGLLQSVQEPQ